MPLTLSIACPHRAAGFKKDFQQHQAATTMLHLRLDNAWGQVLQGHYTVGACIQSGTPGSCVSVCFYIAQSSDLEQPSSGKSALSEARTVMPMCGVILSY